MDEVEIVKDQKQERLEERMSIMNMNKVIYNSHLFKTDPRLFFLQS